MNDRRDTSPKNLDKLMSSMLGYVEQKKQGHKFTAGVQAHVPDKYCTICGAVFGSAPPEAPLKAYICGMCNGKLSEGQTAIVCGNRYAFIVNSKSLEDMKGQVIKVSAETMDAMNQLHSDQVKTKPEPHKFNLKGMKVGDEFMACPKCFEQYPAGGIGPNKCGHCGTDMRVYKVTKDDLIDGSKS